jgi:hypothetical protein
MPTGFSDQQNQPNDTDQTTTNGETMIATGGIQSHAGIIASSSDDLFHPIYNVAPPPLPYTLPDIPFHPNYAYIPHPHPISSSSSYENPNFIIPPHQSAPVPPTLRCMFSFYHYLVYFTYSSLVRPVAF